MTIDPRRVTYNGTALWWFPDGRTLPVLAGAEDPPGNGNGDGQGEGQGDTGNGQGDAGRGQSDQSQGEGKGDDDAGRVRREAAELRKRLREAEEERDKLKQAQMSDAEKTEARAKAAEERASSLEGSLRDAHLTVAVNRHAKDFGIVDAALAAKLLDRSKVSYDDEHQPDPESVKAALKAVVAEHSILTRSGDSDGGRRGPSAPSGTEGLNDWLRAGKSGRQAIGTQ